MWLDSTSLGSGNGKSWKNIKLGIVQPLEKKQKYVDLSSRIGLYATEHNQLKKQVSLCKTGHGFDKSIQLISSSYIYIYLQRFV